MTEDEWFTKGEARLQAWKDYLARFPADLSRNEEDAYMLAWEQAGREMGIVE